MTRDEYRKQSFLLVLLIVMILLALSLCVGCTQKPINQTSTDNPNFEVSYLFEHDGCKLYRFYDGGYNRYWANCPNRAEVRYNRNCGKGCTHEESVETSQ